MNNITAAPIMAEGQWQRLPDGFAGFHASSAVPVGDRCRPRGPLAVGAPCPCRPVGASGERRDRRAGETHKIMTVPHSSPGDLPIPNPACRQAARCSYKWCRWTGRSRLIFPCLTARKIPLDPPLRW